MKKNLVIFMSVLALVLTSASVGFSAPKTGTGDIGGGGGGGPGKHKKNKRDADSTYDQVNQPADPVPFAPPVNGDASRD
jgi:hypothetical protein